MLLNVRNSLLAQAFERRAAPLQLRSGAFSLGQYMHEPRGLVTWKGVGAQGTAVAI